ncbi:hypothetical protein ACP4OV_012274 [Aristida adscensionis]
MASSKVLGDDDLLGEILHRVGSPTSLVRAAAVSRRWLRRASDGAFLRRFRARHPPRLLGFYVSGDWMPLPEFVPMPQPTYPELAAAVRRASFRFDDLPEFSSSSVLGCRNGRVLVVDSHSRREPTTFTVRSPLRRPDGDAAVLPRPPSTCPHTILLPGDDGDDASCYYAAVDNPGGRISVQVSVLRSGAWTLLSSARAELATTSDRVSNVNLLAGGKLYMVAMADYIVELDLAAERISLVSLPNGVEYEYFRNIVLSRGDAAAGAALYLVDVKGDLLRVWLRRTPDAGAGEWVLRDTISIRETCGHLVEQSLDPAAPGECVGCMVGVGDNAEFVFLELYPGGVVVYMDLGSRRVEKVYQRHPDNDEIIVVHPFLMIWPPVLPVLDALEGEAEHT